MTPQQKQNALATIKQKIDIAERTGLRATAESWRELYLNVAKRPAIEIVSAQKPDNGEIQ